METPTFQPLSLVTFGKLFAQLPNHDSLDDFAALLALAALSIFYWVYGRDRPDPYSYKLFEKPQEQMNSPQSSKGTTDIAEKLNQLNADVVVFWGSQSGTAERFAARLCKEIRQRFGQKALAADASDYETSSIAKIPASKLAVFIVSTFGEGDPSDNMLEMCSWLETTKGTPFSQLQFIMLGLGNSNYRYYNAVADLVTEKLTGLGASLLLPLRRADDAQGRTEEHYLEWKLAVFQLLKNKLGFEERDPVYEPSLEVVEDTSLESIDLHHGEPKDPNQDRRRSKNHSPIRSLPIKSSRELFLDTKDRNCIHMELDLSEQAGLKYKTGDHIGVWPVNPPQEVEILLQCLGLQQHSMNNTPISLKSLDAEIKLKAPTPTTWQALFGNYLEVCATVSRESITSLVQFAPSASAKDMLVRLSSDKSSYDQLHSSTYLNLGRLLQYIAPEPEIWKDIPISLIIELLPAMQPRYYSISSSAVVHARRIALTAVVSNNYTNSSSSSSYSSSSFSSSSSPSNSSSAEAAIPGLCTNYLLNLHNRSLHQDSSSSSAMRIYAHIRKSTFKLPPLPSQPIIMIAAGTGIAPFRAFLQERARFLSTGGSKGIGRMILFFGCRNSQQDFLYAEELREWEAMRGLNFSLVLAFSRPGDGREKKMYVQDRVRELAGEVCELLAGEGDAYLYICGSAGMARDVSQVLGGELRVRQRWGEEELRGFVERQKRTRRWQQDVWG